MTYLGFHLLFILPPIVYLAATLPMPLRKLGGVRAQIGLPLLSCIALTYTTPWDNYLIARNIWWYSNDKILAVIGYVPAEEYLFFVLQPILTGLFLFKYLGKHSSNRSAGRALHAWSGFLVFSILTVFGFVVLFSQNQHWVYMSLLLAWASPLIAGMWLYGGESLWKHRDALLYAIGIPTLYLSIADLFALSTGIWSISEQYTIGLNPLGVPIEEVTFFLFTNMLVVKGLLLLLDGSLARN